MRRLAIRTIIVLGAFWACVAATMPARAQASAAGSTAGAKASSKTLAQSPSPLQPAARTAHNEGLDLLQAGHFEDAYKKLLKAWSLQGLPRIPRIAANLGRVELKLGKYRDAAEHLALFLREEKKPSEEDKKELGRQLDVAKTKIGTLRVEVVQPGAEIFIDDVSVVTSPVNHELYVEPGRRKIEAKLGELRAVRESDVRAGASETVKLELTPRTPPRPLVPPLSPAPPPVFPEQKLRFSTRTVVLVSSVVIAAVGLGIGITAGGISLSKQAEQDQCLTKEASYRENCWNVADPERRTFAVTSLAGFIVGGAAVVGGVTYLIAGPKEASKTGTTIRLRPTSSGLLLSGTW